MDVKWEGFLKTFSDGSKIEFAPGKFDDWCVYVTRPKSVRKPPLDTDYFSVMQATGEKYGVELVWADLMRIFSAVGKKPREDVLQGISDVSAKYAPDDVEFDIAATSIYLGMIAEENKANTKLGKRIKLLGLHQVLRENLSVAHAANSSRNKGWREIDEECRRRGF